MMRIIKKIFLIFAAVLVGIIVLTAVCLIALPHVVSGTAFKNRLESFLKDNLEHEIRVDKIDWSLRQGITVSGVTLRDHPEFSDEILAAVDHISLKIAWTRLIRGRFVFDARIVAPRINIIRMADGRINIVDGFAKADTKAQPSEKDVLPAEPEPEKQTEAPAKSFFMPVDIAGTFELTDFSLVLDDRQAGRHIAVTDAGIRLDLPSVKTEAIRVSLHMDLSVDHEPVPRSSIFVNIHDLYDKAGNLTVHKTAVESKIDLPGFTAILAGDMKDAGINGEISADLKVLADLAYLFFPGLAEQMQPAGKLHLIAATSGMPDVAISFDVLIAGDGMGFSGSIIDNRSLSSGNVRIHAAGTYDAREGSLSLDNGEIRLLENTGMALSGRLFGLASADPSADVTLTSMDVHIDEVAHFLRDFIPDILQFSGNETKGPPLFFVRNLAFSGGLKTGPARAACQQISIELPQLMITSPDKSDHITVSGGRLDIYGIEADLVMFLPVSAAFTAGIKADDFKLTSDDRNVSIKNVNMDKLQVRGDNIRTAPDSPFAVAGTFTLTESMDVASVSVAPLLRIDRIHQTLGISASLHPDGTLKAALDGLHLDMGHTAVTPIDRKTLELGLKLDAALPDFTLSGLDPVAVDLSGFRAELAIDNALSLTLIADVKDAGRSMIRGRTNLKADLDLLTKKGGDFIGPDIKCAGIVDLSLNIDGKLPDEKVMADLAALKFDKNLDFITSLAIKALLAEGRLSIGFDDKNRILISGVSGDPLLSYTLKGSSGEGKLLCGLRMENIDGIAGMVPRSPLSVSLVLDAEHRFLSAFDLNQRLDIDPVGIRQVLTVSMDNADRLLVSGNSGAPFSALSRVGAAMSAGVDIADLSKLATLGIGGMPDMDLSGALSARTGLHLIPGNRISGEIRIDLNRANLNLKDMLTVTNANADIDFGKTYKLIIPDHRHPDLGMDRHLLSQEVLRPETPGTRLSERSDNSIYRQMKQLKERTNPSSKIYIDSVALHRGPLPMNAGQSRILFDMVDGLPGINYFQFDLLGGTINGNINLVKGPEDFRVQSALNFSGINMAAFFPELYSGRDDPRAEIRGMLYADIPITHQMPALLENLAFSIEFTKIGSRAIERLLYALDPHESNEAVMAQRRILKNGSPKWIRIDVRDGFLSILGEVTVRTMTIPLPTIQRLNIARLPGIENFASALGPMETVAMLLGRLSAETLAVRPDGQTVIFIK